MSADDRYNDFDPENPPLWDPFFAIPRLSITDKQYRIRPLGRLWPEQARTVDELMVRDMVLVLKARQIGLTTVICLFLLWYLLNRPHGGGCIQITHESKAIASLNGKLRTAMQSVPDRWRPAFSRDTADEIALGPASFHQHMAGGRSQGRAFTYQHQHYTEMAFYPQGSASVKGRGVDRQVWAAVNATVELQPGHKVIVESTANGPGGLFHELCMGARKSSAWGFLFFPWFFTNRYSLPIPERWELTDEERGLLTLYADSGMTENHLAWRRFKLEDQQYDRENFEREYPNNPDEPFRHTGGQFFDLDELNILAARADQRTAKTEFVVWEKPDPSRRYFVGGDPSGGTGRDYATFFVLRDDGKLVCRFRNNRVKPIKFATHLARVASLYGKAPVLVELNHHGRSVDDELIRLGARVWRDDETKKGFWTQRGANNTKDRLLDYAADLIANGSFRPNALDESWLPDPIVIAELSAMVEGKDGNVSVPEDAADDDDDETRVRHDDSAMGWMFALWCAKKYMQRRSQVKLWTPDEARAARFARVHDMVGPTRE